MTTPESVVARVGIDWADQHHDIALQAVGEARVEHRRVPHTPEAIREWITTLRTRWPVGAIEIALETSRGPLLHALFEYAGLVLYPVNPQSVHAFRKAMVPSGAKADPTDAELLLELVTKHRDRLRPWRPEAADLRALQRMVESRRKLVDHRTKLIQQLTAALKEYFPQALDWVGELGSPMAADFLLTWPTLPAVQGTSRAELQRFYRAHHVRRSPQLEERLDAIARATPLTRDAAIIDSSVLVVQALVQQLKALRPSVARFDQAIATYFERQTDAALFQRLPGSGPALAPRLLVLFGTHRERFPRAVDLLQFTGIAPVTKQSGRQRLVTCRWCAPTFARQTLHEYASQTITRSVWARAYYAEQRRRGKDHHAAVRALAFRWTRILWRCWHDRTPYDEARYLAALRRRGTALSKQIESLGNPKAA